MKKLIPVVVMAVSAMMMVGCNDTKKKMPVVTVSDSIRTSEDDNDTTVYGVCGEGSSMHMIQLITDSGDTIEYMFGIEDDNPVQGGLLEGDRMAVCGYKTEDGSLVANKIINLTTLLGKWVSLDKNYEIEEGGTVRNFTNAEKNPWNVWKIYNGNLLLNRDTFEITSLGADSLYLENNNGIFTYKRQKNEGGVKLSQK